MSKHLNLAHCKVEWPIKSIMKRCRQRSPVLITRKGLILNMTNGTVKNNSKNSCGDPFLSAPISWFQNKCNSNSYQQADTHFVNYNPPYREINHGFNSNSALIYIALTGRISKTETELAKLIGSSCMYKTAWTKIFSRGWHKSRLYLTRTVSTIIRDWVHLNIPYSLFFISIILCNKSLYCIMNSNLKNMFSCV